MEVKTWSSLRCYKYIDGLIKAYLTTSVCIEDKKLVLRKQKYEPKYSRLRALSILVIQAELLTLMYAHLN
jgi:hypothetical protein